MDNQVNKDTESRNNIENEFKHEFNSGVIRKSEYFDLFISYKRDHGGDHGQKLAIALHQQLTKDGFKIWLDNEEIGFSNNFEKRIEEALLHSKKIACIIGPAWVESPNCRFEVQKAIEFEKRIIPIHYQGFRQLLTSKKDEGLLTDKEWLRIDHPQEIDFTSEKMYKTGCEDLKEICNLYDDITLLFNRILSESYYWEKYSRPKSMLHIGENLSRTKLLRSKCNSDEELPSFTELQDQFIAASEAYVKTEVTDKKKVYIAFAKEQFEYAAELNMELKLQGVTTYYNDDFSKESAQEEDFIEAILNCETILVVVDTNFPDIKDLRLNFARSHNKRILKVTYSNSTRKKLETEGEKNIHLWNDQLSINKLITLINGDKVYNAFHSKLLGQSFEWEQSEKNNNKLLPRKEANSGKKWYQLAEKEKTEPQPNLSMVNFAERSVAYAETRRKRRIGLLWTGILCVLLIVVFGVVAYLANADATKSQEDALTAKDEAAIAIKSSREAKDEAAIAKDEAAIAKDEAAIAKDEAAIANADAKKAKKKTSALTLSSEAFELTLYAKYDAAKQRADKAVALYNEIEEDFETDILYKTYYSILSNTDLTGDALIFEDVKIIPALDTTYTHCSYESDPDFDLDVVKNVIDEYKMAFSLTYTIDKKYGALGLKSGEIKIFNAAEFTVIDTIFVGTYRVTSMAYNSNGTKLVASTVDDKFTIIPLSSSSGQRNKKKHLIRKESPFRIEEILFENDNTIKTIGGEIVDDGTKSNMSKKYPATVKKLKEILN